MILTYSFDSRMGLYDEESKNKSSWVSDKKYLYDMYKASMIRAKKYGYGINFYGDSDSIKNLEGYFDKSFCIDDINFDLVDDLKIWIHTQNDLDCVTFDGDIILSNKLNFEDDENCDVWFENKETKKSVLDKKWNTYNGYASMLDIFKKHNTDKVVLNYSNTGGLACNVGIIKFNNLKTKKLLIDGYYELKKYYLETIEPIDNLRESNMIPSLIVCQYHFGNTINSNKLTPNFLSNYNRDRYTHWVGEIKFHKTRKDEVYNILNGDTKYSLI